MAPPASFLLPFFLLLTQVYKIGDFSLYDTKIGLILVYCTFNLPFAIWTLQTDGRRDPARAGRGRLSSMARAPGRSSPRSSSRWRGRASR